MLGRKIEFSEEKNIFLKKSRGVNFEDVLDAIGNGNLIKDIKNPGRQYSHQGLLVVIIGVYIYGVPYVYDQEKNTVFLKTVYPSRKLFKSYHKKNYEKKEKRKRTA
ncbi:hypothetical protein A3F34_00615 [Candidatus Roizmanbacteria bacterium RIFCSPHIGHO2_12_FULL_44_10]|uniref:Toxin n=1 Tax=Candidatus Roizmanbacteria bacterium RIFCSPHIGHO2_12_FULL_44_10 TaxID=1802054 RepID=A0A1F7I783_9BACT|nr:MAG: hypothetical protein A3F34_00615 [Candidatus Roizmanbacteria bacterium RIFCSPHIGHO2_12_FULL_44_10]